MLFSQQQGSTTKWTQRQLFKQKYYFSIFFDQAIYDVSIFSFELTEKRLKQEILPLFYAHLVEEMLWDAMWIWEMQDAVCEMIWMLSRDIVNFSWFPWKVHDLDVDRMTVDMTRKYVEVKIEWVINITTI